MTPFPPSLISWQFLDNPAYSGLCDCCDSVCSSRKTRSIAKGMCKLKSVWALLKLHLICFAGNTGLVHKAVVGPLMIIMWFVELLKFATRLRLTQWVFIFPASKSGIPVCTTVWIHQAIKMYPNGMLLYWFLPILSWRLDLETRAFKIWIVYQMAAF